MGGSRRAGLKFPRADPPRSVELAQEQPGGGRHAEPPQEVPTGPPAERPRSRLLRAAVRCWAVLAPVELVMHLAVPGAGLRFPGLAVADRLSLLALDLAALFLAIVATVAGVTLLGRLFQGGIR